jgi:Niemann-Pick C1 protein
MGSSVLVGIAFTKFIGVIVLAFAPSTLFKLYYFRMYLFIIFLGLFNGLMLLPLLLRWLGPSPDMTEIREIELNNIAFEKHGKGTGKKEVREESGHVGNKVSSH